MIDKDIRDLIETYQVSIDNILGDITKNSLNESVALISAFRVFIERLHVILDKEAFRKAKAIFECNSHKYK